MYKLFYIIESVSEENPEDNSSVNKQSNDVWLSFDFMNPKNLAKRGIQIYIHFHTASETFPVKVLQTHAAIGT